MKKIFHLIIILVLPLQLSAQFWLDVGLKGGLGWNLMINNNIINDPNILYDINFGHTIGGKLGFNIGQSDAIDIDIMSTKFKQGFSYKHFTDSTSFEDHKREFSYKNIDFLLLYRKYHEGTYVEIGPQISIMKSASGSDTNPVGFNTDVRDFFQDSYISGALGFGGFLIGTDNFGMTFGFRIKYAFSDLMSSYGQSSNYPNIEQYPSYAGSHPFIIESIIEFNQDFGYLAKHKCSQRKRFILF